MAETETEAPEAPIDYTNPASIAAAAARRAALLANPKTQPYVIGRWKLDEEADALKFFAIEQQKWKGINPRAPLTSKTKCWYRWRTKQAAHQWLKNHPQCGVLTVLNLDSLDVLPLANSKQPA